MRTDSFDHFSIFFIMSKVYAMFPISSVNVLNPVKSQRSPSKHTDPKRCKYGTGYCQNPRAIKLNGQLHGLCELHRRNANRNQQKYDRKTLRPTIHKTASSLISIRKDRLSPTTKAKPFASRYTSLSNAQSLSKFQALLSVCSVNS